MLPVAAIRFVHPALLGALALALVPLIIHLLWRRRYRRVPWGAMHLLAAAVRENRRRMRLEQALLLALRTAACALVVLIVARPVLPAGLAAGAGAGPVVHHVLVLDDSASLGYRPAARSDFDTLRDTALDLVRTLGELPAGGAPVSVYLCSRPDAPLAWRAAAGDALRRELAGRLAAHGPQPWPADAQAVFRDLAGRADRGAALHVWVLSDFQRSDWTSPGREVFRPLAGLPGGEVRVTLLRAAAQRRPNAALTGLRLDPPLAVAGIPVLLTAEVVNYGAAPLEGARLEAQVGGAGGPVVPLEPVPPGGRRAVTAEVTFPVAGWSTAEVRLLPGDALPEDDVHRIAVRVREHLAVLLVNGAPSADPARDEVYLLRTALRPPGPFASGVQVTVADPAQLAAAALEEYDAVIACNLPAPEPAALEALERYVRAGGGLALFLGANVEPVETYNRVLFRDGQGLLPAALGPLRRAEGPFGAAAVYRTAEHPLTAMLPERPPGDPAAGGVWFRSYYACTPPTATQPGADAAAQTAVRVLARLADGRDSPAIVERTFGSGRVVLVTSTADLDWSDWPRALDGSFVVTMLELVRYLAAGRGPVPAETAGATLALSLPADRYAPRGELHPPDFPREPAAVLEAAVPSGPGPAELVLRGPRLTRLGTYQAVLTTRDGQSELRPVCVNLPPGESDLHAAPDAELRAALAGIPHEIRPAGTASRAPLGDRSGEVWRLLVLLLAAVLAGEQFCAWYFGRPERAARRAGAVG